MLAVGGHQIGVDHRQDLRQHLEDSHLAAERREHRRKLHADDAATDDRQTARHLAQLQDAIRVDGQLSALEGDARYRRARGDDDVLAGDRLIADSHLATTTETSRAAERGHATGFEQALDALDELIDHSGLALLCSRPVEPDAFRHQAERLAFTSQRVQLGRLEQRLGRDASAHKARSSHAVLLDDGGGCAQLSGPQSGYVTARAAPDHDHVKRGATHRLHLYEVSTVIMSRVRPARARRP